MKMSFLNQRLLITLSTGFMLAFTSLQAAQSVHYDDFEINQLLNQSTSKHHSSSYIQTYFSSPDPDAVIETLLKTNMTPLEREFVLYNLLTEISQQPPQDFHQNFVDLMKTYPIRATRTAEEGHLPTAVFNLNSKAYGIENIWTAYRTEQHFNQLLNQDTVQAVNQIKTILTEDSRSRRPQWLGIKNSILALSTQSKDQLLNHLLATKSNHGLDPLISFVGLTAAHIGLIEKALTSELTQVREYTLRQLPVHLSPEAAKNLILNHAQVDKDNKFSTSLLNQYSGDKDVETFLIDQLSNKITAANAAFALSQSDSQRLPDLLKKRYLLAENDTEKKHLLLTLKLNDSTAAQLALDDLQPYIEKDSTSARWLQSFNNSGAGDES